LLVKNPNAKQHGQIHFRDIGEYLSAEQKLRIVSDFKSIDGISASKCWEIVTPDKHGDWINKRDESFVNHIAMGDKKSASTLTVFENYSCGVKSNRDVWVYNNSRHALIENIKGSIGFFNKEVERFKEAKKKSDEVVIADFISIDPRKIAWADDFKKYLANGVSIAFDESFVTCSLYRPFSKQWFYNAKHLNWSRYKMPLIFPNSASQNKLIGVSASESRSGFSVLITDSIVSLHAADMVGAQYFPLYLYEKATDDEDEGSLFAKTAAKDADSYTRRDAITDAGLAHFQAAYPAKGEGDTITKEDLFYYIYGLLHSPDYRSRYADNLGKELPRIPAVKTFKPISWPSPKPAASWRIGT
jgi:predicted helicase